MEEELAAVIAQENAMVAVLEGLEALSGAPLEGLGQPQDVTVVKGANELPVTDTESAAKPSGDSAPIGAKAAGTSAGARKAPAKKAAAKKATTRKAATAMKPAAGKSAVGKTSAAGAAERDAASTPDSSAKKAAARKGARNAVRGKVKPTTSQAGLQPEPAATQKPSRAKADGGTGDGTAPAKTPSGRRRLTDAESVLSVLGQGAGPLRAREVARLLGLEDADGAVNAVRTALERLAKAGRAQRTGRGLYTVAAG
ncbi:type IV toxin-antitoxin system AbiEi family antitoxin domain-containing protein [Kitasatospora sp. NPDC056181]|uniref:type IV toxin-antitoxin system AbiEi family antitoxin domain-containing protein n=1 Tax=Kitasatospora sp. NPDC056181 TaxID=3345737 RepID=UPI0035D809DE